MRPNVWKLGIFVILFLFNMTVAVSLFENKSNESSTNDILNQIAKEAPSNKANLPSAPLVLGTYATTIEKSDGRAANLKTFFRKYNSELYDYADEIVAVSDKYNFDYRLLPAIAMQESNVCNKIPANSYNCWGWGIYGDNVLRFSSYDEAIETVAKGIKENYLDQGMVTASQIMKVYTPSSNGSWQQGVNTFLKALE